MRLPLAVILLGFLGFVATNNSKKSDSNAAAFLSTVELQKDKTQYIHAQGWIPSKELIQDINGISQKD